MDVMSNDQCEQVLDMVPTDKDSLTVGHVITIHYGKSEHFHGKCSLCGEEKQCAESVISNSETKVPWHVKALCDSCFDVGMNDLKKLLFDAAVSVLRKGGTP
jgi:hypothetical protein